MQLIEETAYGVRSAQLTLQKTGNGVTFVLFPMIHLGEASFYNEVHRRLRTCDRIVVEGVRGRRTRLITLAYRIAGRFRSDGLVDQGRALVLSDVEDRLIQPDLTAEEFARGWRRVSRRLRWALYLGAPVFGIVIAIVGPRRLMARNVAMEDLPSRDEVLYTPEALHSAIVEHRDVALCAALGSVIGGNRRERVAVCWGAGHMRAVTRYLASQGFRITDSEWITVMA